MGVALRGLPGALLVFAALVVAQWALVALPGGPGFAATGQFVAWLVIEGVLLVLLVRGSFAAWSILLVLNALAAVALAALAAVPPSAAAAVAFAIAVAKLGALAAAGTRGHLQRGPA